MQYLDAVSKMTELSLFFPGKPFNITVMQVYAPTTNDREAQVEWFNEEIQDLIEVIRRKRYPFYHRGLECKSGNSGDSWSNRQVWPWNIK